MINSILYWIVPLIRMYDSQLEQSSVRLPHSFLCSSILSKAKSTSQNGQVTGRWAQMLRICSFNSASANFCAQCGQVFERDQHNGSKQHIRQENVLAHALPFPTQKLFFRTVRTHVYDVCRRLHEQQNWIWVPQYSCNTIRQNLIQIIL